MQSEKQLKLLAAGIYEIRCLLSSALGSSNDAPTDVRLAAHLSYALHNQALSILEGEGDFDVDAAVSAIDAAGKIVGSQYADHFSLLTTQGNAEPGGRPNDDSATASSS